MLESRRRPSRVLAAVWLVYLLFVFLEPYLARAPLWQWLIATLSLVVFLPLYFSAFATTDRPRRAVVYVGAMVVLGLALVPINIGASTYLIFATSVVGYIVPERRRALLLVAALGASLTVTILLTRHPFVYWMLFQPVIVLTVGGGNVLIAEEHRRTRVIQRAQEEVEEMATIAERERIARDLHDLLGHTLSVIALKSELASKIADSDPQRAIHEIREVEQVSRQALTEVRHAVEGFRTKGLAGELESASRALRAAGVTLDREIASVPLPPRQETVLALVLREAVTNVIRHARATRCRVRLARRDEGLSLSVEDDGVGGAVVEGSGLSGMRERVEQAGGTLRLDGGNGFSVTVVFP